MSKALITEQYLSDIADSIRNKLGVNTAYTPAQMASAIDSIGGGTPTPTPVESNDVNFYDYDGTLLYSYSKSDFAQLTAMPANPSHSGLTAQGWNWSLSDAKTFVAANGILDIGQSYVTSDGKTRFYIKIEDVLDATITIKFACSKKGGITIDWGDGNTNVTTSTSATNYSYTYSTVGNYLITLTSTSGTMTFGGSSSNSFFNAYNSRNKIYKIEIGNNVIINKYSFAYNYALEFITLPNNMTITSSQYLVTNALPLQAIVIPSNMADISDRVCSSCYSLKYVSLSKITSMGNYAFSSNYQLKRLTPAIVGGSYAFDGCYLLTTITIPALVDNTLSNAIFQNTRTVFKLTIPATCTEIQSAALASTYNLHEIHFLSTTPPNITNTNAFNSIPATCIFYVPRGYLQTYLDDTNWATFSAKLQEEPS